MSRAGAPARSDVLLVALTVVLGLQTLRAFLPLLVHTYGTRPGVTSIGLGVFAISVFLTAWLAPFVWRLLGAARALRLSAGALVLARVLAQFADPPTMLWLSAAGTVGFLWTVPGLLAFVRPAGDDGAPRRLAIGCVLGFSLDVALAGAFWSWDLVWQRTPTPVLVTIGLALVYGWLLGGLAVGGAGAVGQTAPERGGWWTLAGLGPILLLGVLIFQNPARLTAASGWPFFGALTGVLAANLVAVAVLARLTRSAGAVLAVLALIPAAVLAHGTGPAAIAAFAVGSVAAGVITLPLMAGANRAAGRARARGFAPGARAWALGMLLFAVGAFLYYVTYDIRLPFENAVIVPVAAALAAAFAAPALRKVAMIPPLASGGWRTLGDPRTAAMPRLPGLRLAGMLLAVPAVLWITSRPPAATPGAGWPVRVMSYNLHQGYAVSGMQDLEALAATIEASGADVIALQEVSRGWVINGSTEMLTWLSRRLRMPVVWGPAQDVVQGNAVLSRRPILSSGRIEVPRGGAPMRRGAQWVEVDLGSGERLLVIATHFHHIEGQGHIRVPQAAAVIELWGRRDRTVLLGDLNATPDAREIAMLREAGWRDSFELAGEGDGFTYPSWRPYERIDYVWISPDLSARDFDLLPGQASDHVGIAVTIGR